MEYWSFGGRGGGAEKLKSGNAEMRKAGITRNVRRRASCKTRSTCITLNSSIGKGVLPYISPGFMAMGSPTARNSHYAPGQA